MLSLRDFGEHSTPQKGTFSAVSLPERLKVETSVYAFRLVSDLQQHKAGSFGCV